MSDRNIQNLFLSEEKYAQIVFPGFVALADHQFKRMLFVTTEQNVNNG